MFEPKIGTSTVPRDEGLPQSFRGSDASLNGVEERLANVVGFEGRSDNVMPQPDLL